MLVTEAVTVMESTCGQVLDKVWVIEPGLWSAEEYVMARKQYWLNKAKKLWCVDAEVWEYPINEHDTVHVFVINGHVKSIIIIESRTWGS